MPTCKAENASIQDTRCILILEACKHVTNHTKEVKVGDGVKITSYLILRNILPLRLSG